MAYLGKTPSQAVRSRYYFTASGGETSLSGADDNTNTLTFTDGNYVDVSLNGVALVAGTDYNTTTANTIGGLTALVASDVVEVIVYDTFSVFGGEFRGDISLGDNVKAKFGASDDLQIYHDGTSNIFAGNIVIDGSDTSASIASLAALNIKAGDANNEYSTLRLATSADGSLAMIGAKAITTGAYPNSVGQLELAVQNGTSTNTVLTVTTTSLGIGTSSPSEKLTIQSGNLNFMGGTNDAQYIKFGDTSDDDIGNIFYYHGNNNMVFTTNASEAMRITSAGNVGIGTSAPATPLDVTKAGGGNFVATFQNTTSATPYGVHIKDAASGANGYPLLQVTNSAGSSPYLLVHSGTGNVGIGTSSLTGKAHIYKSSVNSAIIGTSYNGHYFESQSDDATDGFEIYQKHGSNTTRNSFIVNDNRTGSKSAAFLVRGDGNVGIGTSSPSHLIDGRLSGTSSGEVISVGNVTNGSFGGIAISDGGTYPVRHWGTSLEFYTGNSTYSSATERMRIDSSGNVLVGGTTHPDTAYKMFVKVSGSTGGIITRPDADNYTAMGFRNAANGSAGGISVSVSSTSYNTSSDHRLKENVTDVTDGITRVKQLEPKRFNFIADPDKTVDGFLAHEAQTVVPEAITGTHNEVDTDGNPVYQGIDQSKLVPLLTAALKEAITKIETLETEMTSVKARLDALEAN